MLLNTSLDIQYGGYTILFWEITMILLTGAAGFLGFHTAKKLLERDEQVIGIDNLNDYYPTPLKQHRLEKISGISSFEFKQVNIANKHALDDALSGKKITKIVHLAAQAGVRYSIKNPNAYVESNLIGHSNLLELARQHEVKNMVYASSSSVYGGNTSMPFKEDDMTDDPVSFYGASKKSNELLSNSYAHLYKIPLTGLRFFTVYGPMGRPDMAYWIFANKLLKKQQIQIFNNGKMSRDFTFVSDIVSGILSSLDRPASNLGLKVPHRIYNLGNNQPEELMNLIDCIETSFGDTLEKKFMPMQKGDVERTWANIDRAKAELDYIPCVSLQEGIEAFARWYKDEWVQYDT